MSTMSTVRIAAVTATAAGVSYAMYHNRSASNKNVLLDSPPQYRLENRRVSPNTSSETSNGVKELTKLQWNGFTELKLARTEQVSPNVKRLTFALPNETTITGLEPVSSLITQHTPEGAWIPVFRPYTPMSPPTQPGTIEFLIKKYPNGRASGKMHSLKPGDTMKFRPLPAVEYAYTPNQHDDILMIAGGSGITPIWQLVNVILNNPEDRTKIALVYANNSEDDILLRNEIEALEKKYPARFRKVFTVSGGQKPDDSSDVQHGYVSQDIIRKVWTDARADGQKVLVSGPPAMVDSVAGKKGLIGWTQGSVGGVLAGLGYKNGDVHKF